MQKTQSVRAIFTPKSKINVKVKEAGEKSKQKAILGEIREKRRTQNKPRTLDFRRVENQAG